MLTFVFTCLVTGYAVLHHFKRRHIGTWEDEELPESPEDVQDPIYRLVSKARRACCRPMEDDRQCWHPGKTRFMVMDRARGAFVPPDEEKLEPARLVYAC